LERRIPTNHPDFPDSQAAVLAGLTKCPVFQEILMANSEESDI